MPAVPAWLLSLVPCTSRSQQVEGLQSASSKFTKPNDLFVECHMGSPMQWRE